MVTEQIKPENLKELIWDKTKEYNALLELAETMGIPLIVRPNNAISTENKDITCTKSILVITYPTKGDSTKI